jgi:alpha-1,2-glucosyltransferase
MLIRSGDKANHIPSLHVPQLYYFVAFSSIFGWPVLISDEGGVRRLMLEVLTRMFGSKWYAFLCYAFLAFIDNFS